MELFEKVLLPVTLVLLIILGLVFYFNSNFKGSMSDKTDVSLVNKGNLSSNNVYSSQQGEMGAVTIEVTPINPSKYMLTLNTHSVDLGFDFTKIITLTDDLKNTYTPISWTGESGGHHLTGELEFSEINENAKGITLKISEIEGEVLSFEWSL